MLDAHPTNFSRFKKGEDLIDAVKGISFNTYVEKISTEPSLILKLQKIS